MLSLAVVPLVLVVSSQTYAGHHQDSLGPSIERHHYQFDRYPTAQTSYSNPFCIYLGDGINVCAGLTVG